MPEPSIAGAEREMGAVVNQSVARQAGRPQRTKGFDLWMFVHRYVGLILGVWLCAVGATGAIMAYYQEIDVLLNPELFAAQDSPRHPDLDRMIGAVRVAHPDRFILYLDRYALSRDETYPFVLSARLPVIDGRLDVSRIANYDDAAELEVFVDPATAKIVGERDYWTWIKLARLFHRELLMPAKGRKFMGAMGVVLFVSSIAGAVLWWRDGRKRLKRALTVRAGAPMPRLIRDTHTVFGIYASLVIGWLSLTAALICYETPLRELSNWLMGREPAAPVKVAPATDFLSMNRARDIALAEYPNSDVVLIRMAKTPDARLVFRLYPDDQPVSIYTRQVYVNAGTGDIVGRFDPDRQPWTDSLFGVWLIWFHNGGMLGTAGKALNVFAGLVLASLFPTGVYIWWRKRASRAPRAVVADPAVAPAE
ncbi:MAG: PepSY-associated TM helix domain-containing protein [Rhodospirillaceae bacterium]|nr:PepSY-associated TM helix domain-containing protein [Rhodospirillaceae bacterium]